MRYSLGQRSLRWVLCSTVVCAGLGTKPSEGASALPYDLNASQRQACAYGPGSRISETVGAHAPKGSSIPIKHVVVLMMENRSFDHYYSGLKKHYPNAWSEQDSKSVDVWPDGEHIGTSFDKWNRATKQYKEKHYCVRDTAHSWEAVHRQWHGGLMDQFAAESDPGGRRAMGYYDESDLPFYYYLAKNYAISDRYFSPLLGSTWPNRWFFYGATSWGRIKTPDRPVLPGELAQQRDIVSAMKRAGRTVKFYRGGSVQWAMAGFADASRVGSYLEAFESDASANRLSDLSILDPNFIVTHFDKAGNRDDDEHPPNNIQKGQRFAARVIKAITSNPAVWKKTALFITYDEHGGLYDHVKPPAACEPGDASSTGKVDEDGNPVRFDTYGVRVPLIIVSPYAKRQYVSHITADHTSITRFIEAKFGLGALTKRDANAWPLLDMFDFTQVPKVDPALKDALRLAELNPVEDKWCRENEPANGFATGEGGTCVAGTRQADEEPNGAVGLAQELPDPGCHDLSSAWSGLPLVGKKLPSFSGTLNGAGDTDFFVHDAVDTKTCQLEPKVEIKTDGVEVCVFPICKDASKVSLSCHDGAERDELGIVGQGCCRTGKGPIEMDYSCKGTRNESSRIFYRVTQKKLMCTSYTVTYRY